MNMKKTTFKSCLVLSALVLASGFAFSKDAYIIPSFEFTGGGIKIEAEDMLLESGGKVLPQKEKLEEGKLEHGSETRKQASQTQAEESKTS